MPSRTPIDRDFGGLDSVEVQVQRSDRRYFSSGWGWLGYNPQTKKLDIVTTANQDPLLSHVPLIA